MMKHRILLIFAVITWLTAMSIDLNAQVAVDSARRSLAIDSITSPWTDWNTVSISGKFKMAGLPVSPSVKIFMQRDSAVYISLRAPFVGEVGRAEIADSTILVVNKMKKTYVEEPIEKALDYYPGGISDIQDLILGRIVIPGFGLLDKENQDIVEIYDGGEGTSLIVAAEAASIPDFQYGYLVNPEWQTAALMVLPLKRQGVVVKLEYEYFGDGYDLDFSYQSEKKNHRATLELNAPEWEGKGFDRVKLNSKYTRLPFDEFLKSF